MTISLTNSLGAVATPPGPFISTTDANGMMNIVFTSNTAGTVTGHAATDVAFARLLSEQPPSTPLTVHRETDGLQTNVNPPSGVFNGVDAVKNFIDAAIGWLKVQDFDAASISAALRRHFRSGADG